MYISPHSSTVSWKIPWWRSLEGCSSWGHWGSDTTEQLHFHFSLSCIGEGNGNPLQCSCLENPRDGELPSMESHRVRHNWSDLAAAAEIYIYIEKAYRSFSKVKLRPWEIFESLLLQEGTCWSDLLLSQEGEMQKMFEQAKVKLRHIFPEDWIKSESVNPDSEKIPVVDHGVFDRTVPLGTTGRSGFPGKNWAFLLPDFLGRGEKLTFIPSMCPVEATGRQWRTGKPGVLQSMGSQRVRHDGTTERQPQRQQSSSQGFPERACGPR